MPPDPERERDRKLNQSYPWYIADWRESETRIRLSLAERALYRELLDYCYLEGSIPTDHVQLSRIAGCSVSEITHHFKVVRDLFYAKDGRLAHAKVDEVRAKLETYHKQKKHAGAASGRARRQRALNGRSNEADTGLEPSPAPSPAPSHTEDPVRLPPAPPKPVVMLDSASFEIWLAPWPMCADPDSAARAWISAVTPATTAAAFAARDRYLASDEVARNVVMAPHNFIFQQARNGWNGKWPRPRAPEQTAGSMDSTRALWDKMEAKRKANGR